MIDRLLSPRGFNQPYIWWANYGDKILTEFEDSGKENPFSSIEKDKLVEFGLIGRGQKLSFNIKTGIFDMYDKKIKFVIEYDGKDVLELATNDVDFKDIITYKSAVSMHGKSGASITGYYVGYKNGFLINDNLVYSKVIFIHPMNDQKKYFNIRVGSNKGIKGNLKIIVNDELKQTVPIDFKPNEAHELSWVLETEN